MRGGLCWSWGRAGLRQELVNSHVPRHSSALAGSCVGDMACVSGLFLAGVLATAALQSPSRCPPRPSRPWEGEDACVRSPVLGVVGRVSGGCGMP